MRSLKAKFLFLKHTLHLRNTLYKPSAHRVRIWGNNELKRIAHLFNGNIVNLSGWEDKDKEGDFYRNYFKNASSYTITNFSHSLDSKDDVYLDLKDDLPSDMIEKYDVVYNHTTLEHIFNIFKAFKNLCLISKDIVIVVVPFIQCQHETPDFNDYWRFTPSCLRRLFEENKMTVIYESFSRIKHDVNYFFFVASKNPEKWKGRMPEYQKLTGLLAPWVR